MSRKTTTESEVKMSIDPEVFHFGSVVITDYAGRGVGYFARIDLVTEKHSVAREVVVADTNYNVSREVICEVAVNHDCTELTATVISYNGLAGIHIAIKVSEYSCRRQDKGTVFVAFGFTKEEVRTLAREGYTVTRLAW